MSFTIRPAMPPDRDGIVALHKAAAVTPGALARAPEEVTSDYGDYALASDICLVAVEPDGTVVGEIHAKRETIALFAHVLGGLTVAVHPDRQGRGIGSKLFEALIAWARVASMDAPSGSHISTRISNRSDCGKNCFSTRCIATSPTTSAATVSAITLRRCVRHPFTMARKRR